MNILLDLLQKKTKIGHGRENSEGLRRISEMEAGTVRFYLSPSQSA